MVNGLIPSAVSGAKIMIPPVSSPSPSSMAEHNIPSLSIPNMPRRAMSRPSGIVVPIVANATTSFSFILVAPHHTCFSIPSPLSTHTRVTRSASGCFCVRSTRAVTTPSTAVPTTSIDSTAKPNVLRAVAMTSWSSPTSAYSRKIDRRTFM